MECSTANSSISAQDSTVDNFVELHAVRTSVDVTANAVIVIAALLNMLSPSVVTVQWIS